MGKGDITKEDLKPKTTTTSRGVVSTEDEKFDIASDEEIAEVAPEPEEEVAEEVVDITKKLDVKEEKAPKKKRGRSKMVDLILQHGLTHNYKGMYFTRGKAMTVSSEDSEYLLSKTYRDSRGKEHNYFIKAEEFNTGE